MTEEVKEEIRKDYVVLVPLVSRGYEAPFPGYSGDLTPGSDPSHAYEGFRGAYMFYKKLTNVTLEEAKLEKDNAEKLAQERLYRSPLMKSWAVALHNVTDDESVGKGYLFDSEYSSNEVLRDKYEIL